VPVLVAGEPYDVRLFQLLRAVRKRIADENGWPPYAVFHDAALKEMSRTCPKTERELSRIPGVGRKKIDSFGGEFIGAINAYAIAGTAT
jgi:ATP-dependent DNA helicase RecQ